MGVPKWGPNLGPKMGTFGPQIYSTIYLRARVKKKTSKMELLVNPINRLETDILAKTPYFVFYTK